VLSAPDVRRPAATPRSAVLTGAALVVAELVLAVLWYPWVVDHLVLRSSLPYAVLRLLIVAPEYALLAVAVAVIARSAVRGTTAVALALAAGAVAWGSSLLLHHLVQTPHDLAAHHGTATFINDVTIIAVPLLAALAWGAARRTGQLWVLGVLVAPAMRWWIEHGQWWFNLTDGHSFRVTEAVGMALAILPVLLAILACWALDQVETGRTAA
jgi:hypothetical protein